MGPVKVIRSPPPVPCPDVTEEMVRLWDWFCSEVPGPPYRPTTWPGRYDAPAPAATVTEDAPEEIPAVSGVNAAAASCCSPALICEALTGPATATLRSCGAGAWNGSA